MERKLYSTQYVKELERKVKFNTEIPKMAIKLLEASVLFIDKNNQQEDFEEYLKENYPDVVESVRGVKNVQER